MTAGTVMALVLGGLVGSALVAGAAEHVKWHARRRRYERRLRARFERFEVKS